MIKEEINIGGCGFIYIQDKNEYSLYYNNEEEWREDLRGKLSSYIIDTGNGLKITQNKKSNLDYSEAAELKFLLNKITDL